jgi:Domain of unknown function DUF29
MSNLYDTDILIWSERQADLLRRVAAGERINDRVDWANVVEEIESVGSELLHAVRSYLVQALLHMLKAEAWPLASCVPHWRAEAIRFRQEAVDRFTPSMSQRIDMTTLYRRALRQMPETIDCLPPLPVPQVCQVTLDELLSEP